MRVCVIVLRPLLSSPSFLKLLVFLLIDVGVITL